MVARRSASSRSVATFFGISGRFGANAEFICVAESARIGHMPAGTSFQRRCFDRRRAAQRARCSQGVGLREGQKILVYGASGAIGTAPVQRPSTSAPRSLLCAPTKNLELMSALGAATVIDYTRKDSTENGETYDVIVDAVGKHSFRRCRRSLKPGGTYIRRILASCGTSHFAPVDWVDRRQAGDAPDAEVHEERRRLSQGADRGRRRRPRLSSIKD